MISRGKQVKKILLIQPATGRILSPRAIKKPNTLNSIVNRIIVIWVLQYRNDKYTIKIAQ